MLFDLLRLASIGQNMELLASLHQHHQARQQLPPPPPPRHQNLESHQQTPQIRASQNRSHRTQRYRGHQPNHHHHHQDFHCEEEFREEGQLDNQPITIQTNQCKPLDLTVKNATQTQARQSSNKIRSARLAPLVIEPHKIMAPNGSNVKRTRVASTLSHQRRKRAINRDVTQSTSYQPQPPHSATKLISSSTSPSSCSRSASASSNESKSSNDLMISSTNTNTNTTNNLSGSPTNTKLAIQQAAASTTSNATAAATATTTSINKRQKHKNLKSHLCHQCGRSFSRSDMLTRHSRLHSGLKPYQCGKCKQVFSRSDHLSTHERTHTGEKPYQCERCAYSACRRDMITRHMRTHSALGPIDHSTRTIRSRSPKLLARTTINHFQPIKKVKRMKPKFNFEQDISSSSFEGDSPSITDEEEDDDEPDDDVVDLEP